MVKGFAKVVKYTLFLANFIILLSGIAAFSVGVWTLADRSFMERIFGSDLYVSSASTLIATGVIVTLISFLGCFGAIKEKKCLLLTFFIILFMIFFIMLVGGILGYVYNDEVEKSMHQAMMMSVSKYKNVTAITDSWDRLQESFKCCGMTTDDDDSYLIWQKMNGAFQNDTTVPDSCCKLKNNQFILKCQSDPKNHVYPKDCYIEMKYFLKKHALILGGVGIGTSCVLIVGMMLSCALYLMINGATPKEVNH